MQRSQERLTLAKRLQTNKNTLEVMSKKMRAYGQSARVAMVSIAHSLRQPTDRALSKARAREAEAKAETGLGQLSAQRRLEILVGDNSSHNVMCCFVENIILAWPQGQFPPVLFVLDTNVWMEGFGNGYTQVRARFHVRRG